MDELLELVAISCKLPAAHIRGRKRRSRKVSYAKMLFCWFAWDSLKVPQCEIARFLGYPRENVYYLIVAAKRNQKYDKEFRELHFVISNA